MKYTVHMISLKSEDSNGCSCVFGKGENLVDGHIEAVEDWLYRMKNPAPIKTLDDLL